MKYWSYLTAKLLAAAGLLWGMHAAMLWLLPPPDRVWQRENTTPVGTDLLWTTAYLLFWLVVVGVLTLILIDQRYRCRTCLRRLRMPVMTGSWPNPLLVAPPRIEYICPYGHGTLKVPELHMSGQEHPDWHRHDDDIWKELAGTRSED